MRLVPKIEHPNSSTNEHLPRVPLEFAACRSGLEVCFQLDLGLWSCREASLK